MRIPKCICSGKGWYFGLDVAPVNQYQIHMVCYCVSTGKNELINWKHKLRKAQVQLGSTMEGLFH